MLLTALMTVVSGMAKSGDYTLTSPDGKTVVTITKGVTLSVSRQGDNLVTVKAALNEADEKLLNVRIGKTKEEQIVSPFYRQKQFSVTYRQSEVKLSDNWLMWSSLSSFNSFLISPFTSSVYINLSTSFMRTSSFWSVSAT